MPISATNIAIRAARPEDATLVHGFILELAEYEKLAHAAVVTVEQVATALFRNLRPGPSRDIVQAEGVDVGFALWVYNFSTFVGRAGIWLEDSVCAAGGARSRLGQGAPCPPRAPLPRRGFGRLEWAVLNWTPPPSPSMTPRAQKP